MKSSSPAHRSIPRIEALALSAPEYLGSPFSLVIHSVFFVGIFVLQLFGFSFDQVMLILTTLVSLEAIYLSLFIQMTVNRHAKQIEEVSDDVEEISKDIDTIQEDVKEISDDVDDISEDVEELGDEIEQDDHEDAIERTEDQKRIDRIELAIEVLLREVQTIQKEK